VWDAKFSKNGRYPSTLSAVELKAWQGDIQAAVNDYAGAYAADIRNALANNQIAGRISRTTEPRQVGVPGESGESSHCHTVDTAGGVPALRGDQ
jgi:hypothetical protein